MAGSLPDVTISTDLDSAELCCAAAAEAESLDEVLIQACNFNVVDSTSNLIFESNQCQEVISETRTYLDNDGMPIPGALAVKFDKPAENVSSDRCCAVGCDNSENDNPLRNLLDACASSERVEGEPSYEGVNIEFCVETT